MNSITRCVKEGKGTDKLCLTAGHLPLAKVRTLAEHRRPMTMEDGARKEGK